MLASVSPSQKSNCNGCPLTPPALLIARTAALSAATSSGRETLGLLKFVIKPIWYGVELAPAPFWDVATNAEVPIRQALARTVRHERSQKEDRKSTRRNSSHG